MAVVVLSAILVAAAWWLAQVGDVLPEREYEAQHIPGAFNIPLKRAEKPKKPRNSPKGLTILNSFTVYEPLNILCLKTRVLTPEGDNNEYYAFPLYFSDLNIL